MRKIVEIKTLRDAPSFRHVLELIHEDRPVVEIEGLYGASRALLAALVFDARQKPMAVICPSEKDAQALVADLRLFLGDQPILYYPPLDYLTIDMFALQRAEELERLRALTHLQVDSRRIVVTCLAACIQKIMPYDEFHAYLRIVSLGDALAPDELAASLMGGGYRRVPLVMEPGEFSVRGYILDVYPPTEDLPLRLELVGDEIESIRRFEPATQRSASETDAFILGPASEVLIDEERIARAVRNVKRRADELDLTRDVRNRLTETLKTQSAAAVNPVFLPLFYEDPDGPEGRALSAFFDYLPQDTLLVMDDPQALRQAMATAREHLDRLLFKSKNSGKFHLDAESVCLDDETYEARITARQRVELTGLTLDAPQEASRRAVLDARREFEPMLPVAGEIKEETLLRQTAARIKDRLSEGLQVVMVAPTPEDTTRIRQLLAVYDVQSHELDASEPLLDELCARVPLPGLGLRTGRISTGFVMPGLKLAVMSEEEIFVRKTPRRRSRPRREGYFLKSFGELNEGDFVVHTDFGIGLYRGLQKIRVGRIENDFLVIEYQGGDKLYLPVNALDKIQRYLGPEGFTPKIDKMGGPSWDSVKARVKQSVRDVAEELIAIYAAREAMERKVFGPPDRLYEEFCSTFEFEETPDQLKAIEDIHADLDDVKPMDRLICGDAGFGKTEVALRAAFRAVMDGRQVALLAPTTILVEQHVATFTHRLKDFPIRVEALNRFKSVAEQKQTVADLNTGRVDIVIGTHRLLQKDIAFKNLGLVIIDEEQRFGVAHKETLKKMRTLVDVLTLSATPIPRTLHLSLVGIRDLSIINTPPAERQPIKTYVLEFDEDTIRHAIEQELARAGQVFFLHDRVRSIYSIARLAQRLVPHAKVGVVHGQMKPADIEKTMSAFIRREFDVLVCTTIIGSGLDIPQANTIIINRADRFGLAQLYQIRGRVGRGNVEAAAYLLVPKGAMLSRDAQKRLAAIKEFNEPGSGFRIAYNDLEIRGGGNLLGLSQAGHISAVGYELYTELMEQTVREIQGGEVQVEEPLPEIQMGVSAFIPEEYVADIHQRLILYKRISMSFDTGELDDIRRELADCYGPVPQTVENLLEVIALRNDLQPLLAKKMTFDGQSFTILFRETSPVDPSRIIELSAKKIKGLRLTPDLRLITPASAIADGDILAKARELLKMLAQTR